MKQNNIVNTLATTEVYRPVCPHPIYFGSTKNHQQVVKRQSCYFYLNNSTDGFVNSLQEIRDLLRIKVQEEIKKYDDLLHTQNYTKTEACENTHGYFDDDHLPEKVKIEEEESELLESKPRVKSSSSINDTKNIPKNFGKAIITFIQKNRKVVTQCLARYNIDVEMFIKELKLKKKCLHSIKQLRSLWVDEDFPYAKPFRQLSYYFLRKGTFKYVFGSRVADFGSHLKYRFRIMKALEDPKAFNSIKM